MLAKCLKYDLKSVFRFWWIGAAVVLGTACSSSAMFRLISVGFEDDFFVAMLMMLSMLAWGFSLAGFVILSELLVYFRYYRNFFTDEGYLTFTLPVSRKTLLLSKAATAFSAFTATFLVGVLSCGIVFLGIPTNFETGSGSFVLEALFGEYGLIAGLWENLGGWVFLYGFEYVVLFLLLGLVSSLWIFFCITLSSVLVRKYKLLVAIGMIWGSGQILSLLYYGMMFCSSFFGMGLVGFLETADPSKTLVFVALALFFVIAALASILVLLWNLTLGCLERKLNLA